MRKLLALGQRSASLSLLLVCHLSLFCLWCLVHACAGARKTSACRTRLTRTEYEASMCTTAASFLDTCYAAARGTMRCCPFARSEAIGMHPPSNALLPLSLPRTNTANQTQGSSRPTYIRRSTMPVIPHNNTGVANLISTKEMEEVTKAQHKGTREQQQAADNNTNSKLPPKHYDSTGIHSQHQQLQQPRSNKQN